MDYLNFPSVSSFFHNFSLSFLLSFFISPFPLSLPIFFIHLLLSPSLYTYSPSLQSPLPPIPPSLPPTSEILEGLISGIEGVCALSNLSKRLHENIHYSGNLLRIIDIFRAIWDVILFLLFYYYYYLLLLLLLHTHKQTHKH